MRDPAKGDSPLPPRSTTIPANSYKQHPHALAAFGLVDKDDTLYGSGGETSLPSLAETNYWPEHCWYCAMVNKWAT